jgi:hypothetical protein
MAKIALICHNLHPQVLNLATQLSTHKNEVLLITSRDQTMDEQYPENVNFQIIRPFQKWSAMEAIRLFTRLLGNMPDVFHFVFTNSNQTPTVAHFVLGQLLQPIPGRVVASSFFHSPNELSHFRMKLFLRGHHLVTWGTSAHLLNARRKLSISKHSLSEVIPPLSNENLQSTDTHSIQMEQLLNSLGDYLLIPGNPEDFFKKAKKNELTFENKMKLVFLCERPETRKHQLDVFYLGNPVGVDLLYAIQKARGILLAFSDLSLLELQQFYQWGRLTGTPLLVRPRQTEMHPGIVTENKTGWVLPQGETSLRDLLKQNPSLRIQRKQDQQPMLDLVDSTMNELNRLYHKAIALRR